MAPPADDDLLAWTITDAPFREAPDPPAGAATPAAARRLSRGTWLMTGGAALAVLALVWLGALGEDWLDAWQTRQVVAQEEQAALDQDLAALRALADPAGGVWLTQRLDAAEAGAPAPLPFGYLRATGAAGRVIAASLAGPDLQRVDVARTFQDPTGAFYTFALPQFYRETPDGWRRVPPPAEFWGTPVTVAGQRLVISVPPVDEAWARELLPGLETLLARFCAETPCPPEPITLLFGHTSFPRPERPELLAGDPLLLGLMPPVVSRYPQTAVLAPTPSDVGYPVEAAGRDLLRRAIAAQVLYAAADRAAYGPARVEAVPNVFFFALVARLCARYEVEAEPGRVTALPLIQAPSLDELWALRIGAWRRLDLIRHALALLNYWLADQPPDTDLRLLQLIGTAPSLDAWWTAGAENAP